MLFHDRAEAGRELAAHLTAYTDRPDVLVLALPRGGVPVAYEVARALRAPLDVFLVRKLGVPGQEELAMGALATGGVLVLNDEVVQALGIPDWTIDEVARQEERELRRREQSYRGGRPPPDPRGRTVILIDDGLATGSTMRAAVAALRRQEPARIVVAVPIGAADTCADFQAAADEVVCARTPEPFHSVGLWYDDFSQTTDEEVHDLLERASKTAERSGNPEISEVPSSRGGAS
jgi:predicted phosphoribosyltransferase